MAGVDDEEEEEEDDDEEEGIVGGLDCCVCDESWKERPVCCCGVVEVETSMSPELAGSGIGTRLLQRLCTLYLHSSFGLSVKNEWGGKKDEVKCVLKRVFVFVTVAIISLMSETPNNLTKE